MESNQQNEPPRSNSTSYPSLAPHPSIISNAPKGQIKDIDYILLETEVGQGDESDEGICCFGKGIWYSIDELYKILNSEITQIDVIIAMSPQHERLTQVFKKLGYNYIIGVEAPNNNVSFTRTETSAFLNQLYAALLERRSVSRSYYLSLQAALTSRGSNIRGGNDNDPKYILCIDSDNINDFDINDRFILFNNIELKYGEINDKSQHEKLPKTNLREPIRPFIGRSEYVIELLKKLTDTQIVNVPGKELIGRASVVKSTTRYLVQMGFFRGGCFVIDCKLQSKKYHNNKTKTFNECVYDVLKSCGVDFKTQPDSVVDGNEELYDIIEQQEEEEQIPQMNNTLNLNSIGHYSQRSSSRFPNMKDISQQLIEDDGNDSGSGSDENDNSGDSTPVINKEYGDPKHSPRSLFEYLENSIFYDQKPPSHEPFCFVILNMNHWHNGSDKVTEWITKFSQQLFKEVDSRIICTGNQTLNISNVSTLNMLQLNNFSKRKLSKLFKYFCRDFESKFNPSIHEIEKHKQLQSIFDGRPGMTKKVSQYVRYLFAFKEQQSNDDDDEKESNDVNLDEIAKNYPLSTYAVHLKDISPSPSQSQSQKLKNYSTSVPSDIGRKKFIDDSNINLNTEGHQLLNDNHASLINNSSTPKFTNQTFFKSAGKITNNNNNVSDPKVLIPDKQINSNISILPPDNSRGGWSPPVAYINRRNNYNNNNMYTLPQQHQQQQYYQQQQQQQQYYQQQQPPPPPPPQTQQYGYSNNNMYSPMQPTSRLFSSSGNRIGNNVNMGMGSQSLSQLGGQYRHNNNGTTIVKTTLQTTYTTNNPNPSIPTNMLRYESIEKLPNSNNNKTITKHSGEVQNLFINGNNNNNKIQTDKSQTLALNNMNQNNNNKKQSFTFIISDPNNKSREFSHTQMGFLQTVHHVNDTSTTDNLMPSHRLRNLNKSIDKNETKNNVKENGYNITSQPFPNTRRTQQSSQIINTNTMIITAPLFPRNGSINVVASNITNLPNGMPDMMHRRSSSVPDQFLNGNTCASRQGSIMETRVIDTIKNKQNENENDKNKNKNKSINVIIPGHSLQFSQLTEISVLNEQTSVEVNNNLIAFNNIHNKNDSFLVSPNNLLQPSVTSQIPMETATEGGMGTTNHPMTLLKGVQSAPLTYDNNKLTSNNKIYDTMAKTDCAIIGINHSYSARKIWMTSCLSSDNNIAKLKDLFPYLMEEFKRLTRCDKRQPTLQQIELFFVRTGGLYGINESLPFIKADKFDKFFAWFRSMCSIIKDLRPMYNRALQDPLIGLFYGRTTAQETLEHKPEGTFILRLASQQNGLAITYKNPIGKIQNVLLTRISNEMYRVGKSDKETLLFNLIRPWDKLKYLYTPNKLIRKKFIF